MGKAGTRVPDTRESTSWRNSIGAGVAGVQLKKQESDCNGVRSQKPQSREVEIFTEKQKLKEGIAM